MSNLTGDKYLELVEKSGLLEAAVVTKMLADFVSGALRDR